jgi:hypothetical protein
VIAVPKSTTIQRAIRICLAADRIDEPVGADLLRRHVPDFDPENQRDCRRACTAHGMYYVSTASTIAESRAAERRFREYAPADALRVYSSRMHDG